MAKVKIDKCPECGSGTVKFHEGLATRKGKPVPNYFECQDCHHKFEARFDVSGRLNITLLE